MPLTNNVIIKLNEITTMIEDKTRLNNEQADSIKQIFKELLQKGERYDVDEIEYWFENEGSWNDKSTRVRITNISHYVQDKFEQTSHLRLISDTQDSCSDDSCGCGN